MPHLSSLMANPYTALSYTPHGFARIPLTYIKINHKSLPSLTNLRKSLTTSQKKHQQLLMSTTTRIKVRKTTPLNA
ncbi:hypothetical protein AMATHDRAFT_10172 [Amanita thiersii Skay4041]|uniref:Uncharacterized protein n=1 Tax=Amanita thiersii Skay4041 TaxID=703135 RepID=A0A2A9N7Y6_9AGAR|nr:hypothetical protein AMATHDRAFT_10172 [Amanita thiersii Skay4041]